MTLRWPCGWKKGRCRALPESCATLPTVTRGTRSCGMPRVSDVAGLIATKNVLFLATSVLAIWGLLLAWKRSIHGVFLFATLLVFYPLVYYVCFPELRYRHPIDPELLIL